MDNAINSNTALTVQSRQRAFVPTAGEYIAAAVSYVAAYLYTYLLLASWDRLGNKGIILTAFALIFCGGTELFYRDRKAPKESFVWLGCMWLLIIAIDLQRSNVWGAYSVVILHIFAVYWVCARSGCLCAGRSSIFLPIDGINAFIVVPAKNIVFRTRAMWYALTNTGRRKGKKAVFVAAAAVVGCILLYMAGSLLSAADDNFGSMIQGIFEFFDEKFMNLLLRFIISLPVGAYLTGLVVGYGRQTPDTDGCRAEKYSAALSGARKVPCLAWTVISAVFCLFYAVFFIIQARYLLGAFSHTLPAGFTVAQYARQGFFQMCRIMALNFLLVLLVAKTSDNYTGAIKAAVTALLATSVLFAVVAMSKLVLYISCFGFTPLRLASSWLVFTLLSGCVFAGVNIWTGKRTMCPWLILSAVTMSLLAFV